MARDGDDVLDVLTDFEDGLEALKKLYTQRRELQAQLAEREAALSKVDAELGAQRRTIEQHQSDLEKERSEIERLQRQKSDKEGLLAKRLEQMDQRDAELAGLASKFAAEQKALADRAEQQEQQHAELESARAGFEAKARELAGVAERFERERADLERAREATKAERAAAANDRKAAESLAEEVSRRERELVARAEAVKDGEAQRVKLQDRLSRAEQTVREVTTLAEREAEEANSKAATAIRELELARARLAAEQAGRKEAEDRFKRSEAEVARATESAGGDESERQREVIEELTSRLRAATNAQKQSESQVERLGTEVEGARLALEKTRAELASRGESARHTRARSRSDEEVERRRFRLKRVKQGLRARADKISKASDALKQRYERHEQAEKVLAQRSELITAKQALDEAQKRVQRMWAKTRASTLLFYALASLALLAGGSWLAADRIFPGVYTAKTTVRADARGRELTDGELDEWRSFHEQLLVDPTFMEVAAERMGRRGLATLGTPGALAERLKTDLETSSKDLGDLTLEMKGVGAERTTRVLDTLVTALASQANAARERRVDGAVTVIESPATAGARPIEDKRLIYSGLILAGGTLVSLVVSMGIWRALAAAKMKFDREVQMDTVLDQARWPDLAKNKAA